MDGNGRWAEHRGLARAEGHRTALARMFEIVDGALAIGVRWLSVFAFSSENWRRSPDEVRGLLDCCREGAALERLGGILARDIRIRWCGLPEGMPADLVEALRGLEKATASGSAMTCTLCFNYGGRADIVQATRMAMEQARTGRLSPDELDEAALGRFMLTAEMPDVDLLIRSGGEQRLSNFMLWQSAYAEIVFLPQLWPDVTRRHLWDAVEAYARRERRFGAASTSTSTPVSP
jgi:undecaprenyl diphosphate synthase